MLSGTICVGPVNASKLELSYLNELGEVPRIPLTNAHSESVDVLVQLIEKRDALDDHVIYAVDVELDLAARVSVRKTELRLLKLAVLQLAKELGEMKTNATKELSNCVALCARNMESFYAR